MTLEEYTNSIVHFTLGNATDYLHLSKMPEVDKRMISQLEQKSGLVFVAEKNTEDNLCYLDSSELRDEYRTTFAPTDLLHFIYASVNATVNEGKSHDFFYPKDTAIFWRMVRLGEEIQKIHLLDNPLLERFITQYPVAGHNLVVQAEYLKGKVFINDHQYFTNVPARIWNFFIGGNQPAQKWLKDRLGQKLQSEDIYHYQKIIVAIIETDRLMKEIDLVMTQV